MHGKVSHVKDTLNGILTLIVVRGERRERQVHLSIRLAAMDAVLAWFTASWLHAAAGVALAVAVVVAVLIGLVARELFRPAPKVRARVSADRPPASGPRAARRHADGDSRVRVLLQSV